MVFDGITFRKLSNYGWRNGDPTRDVDLHGKPVPSNYLVIVKLKDCVVFDGIYDSLDAPQAFPIAYTLTNMGYGKASILDGESVGTWNKKKMRRTPVYLVHSGKVWSGAITKEIK